MKFLILMLALLIAAPTVQAGICDMDHSQEASQNTEMQHHGEDGGNHDCCDSEDTEANHFCDNSLDCSNSSTGMPALTAMSQKFDQWNRTYLCNLAEDCLAPSHSSPPFRPPIS